LRRRNLNKLPRFKEEKETVRYEKKKPFEMVHIDIKYVGNLKGQGRVFQKSSKSEQELPMLNYIGEKLQRIASLS
jgi:hypothetical protein